MAQHPKQREYDRRTRLRAALDAQALLLGWTKVDLLTAYETPEGLVAVDKSGKRIGIRADELVPQDIIQPLEIDAEEAGVLWQEKRTKIGAEIAEIDLTKLTRREALEHFEVETKSLLGMIVALRSVEDGPDWRDQIGLPA